MKDNNVPPLPRIPRRRRFLSMVDAFQKEATALVPSINRGNGRTTGPLQGNSGLASIETMQVPGVKQPSSTHLLDAEETRPVPVSRQKQPATPARSPRPASSNGVWRPGTLGFDEPPQDGPGDDFKEVLTIPMLVLKDISNQQGQSAPAMQSEISGATGAAAMVGLGNVAGTVFRYGSNLMIQRGFGAGAYGLYSLCMSLVTLASSIFTLGLDNAMIRYISIYRSKKQSRSLIGLTVFCTALVGVTGVIGALLLMFLAPFIADVKHDHHLARLLEVMSPLVPLTCLQVVWFAGLQGFKAFKWRVIAQRLLPALVMIALVGGVLVLHHSKNPYNGIFYVALATIGSTGTGVLLSLYYLFRQVSRTAERGPERYELREWLVFSTPNFLSSIVDTVMVSTDTIFLAVFAISNIQIGYYTAAIKISTFISLPLVSLNAMFTPIIAELHAKGELQKLTSMFKLVTKWTLTLSLPIFCIATLFSVSLLGISGGNFASAWPLLIALSVGNLVNAGTGSVGYMLLMTGHQKLSFLNSLVAVVFNVIFNIILTPRYGAMGTAISTGLAYTIVNLMRLLQVYVLLKIQPYRWDSLKPLGAGLISSAVTGALLYLFSYAHLSIHVGHGSLSLEILLAPVFLAMYIGLVRLFKFSSEDKIVIDALRKKIRRRKK